LRDKVVLDASNINPHGNKLIAVGPLTKQPSTNPLRTVLVDLGDKFVVWRQFWMDCEYTKDGNLQPVGQGFFEQGDYFFPYQLVEATAKFAERVTRDASCIRSIYREN